MQVKKSDSLNNLDRQIRQIQQALADLGPMRPGTLSRQYRQPEQRRGAYYQLSYTFQMRSCTEYVRPEEVTEVRQEIARYKRYRRLNLRWVSLTLRRAKLRMKLQRAARPTENSSQGCPEKRMLEGK
jgi:hypothetical protein